MCHKGTNTYNYRVTRDVCLGRFYKISVLLCLGQDILIVMFQSLERHLKYSTNLSI